MNDVIDELAGIAPGSWLDALRRRKPVTRDNAQASFEALFAPSSFGGVSAVERTALAAFVAGLHQDGPGKAFYGARLRTTGAPNELVSAVEAEAQAGAGQGPYGSYPAGPLTAENQPGPAYQVRPDTRPALGQRLSAAFGHAHMLVLHSRDSAPDALRKLEHAGWTADDIVTLSQLVAFLSFQLRAAFGLRALAASPKEAEAA